jgi:hypothetical protein
VTPERLARERARVRVRLGMQRLQRRLRIAVSFETFRDMSLAEVRAQKDQRA